VILDDRGERPGAMFADWELIGVPHRVVVGDRGLKEGKLEYVARRGEATMFRLLRCWLSFSPSWQNNDAATRLGPGLTGSV
jgi:hypothetical protein